MIPDPGTAPAMANVETSLDVATYQCECGFVFEAEVLTTVSCPHCGNAQAW